MQNGNRRLSRFLPDTYIHLLLEQSPSVIWSTDVKLIIKTFYGPVLKKYDLKFGEVVNLSIKELAGLFSGSKEAYKSAVAAHKKVLNGKTAELELFNNGLWWKIKILPLKDKKRKIIGCIGTAYDITENKNYELQLKKYQKELRALNEHINKRFEDERTRIARELHDEIGQALTLLKIDLSQLYKLCDSGDKFNNALMQEKLAKISQMKDYADTTLKTVRRISFDLRPFILDDFGLIAGMEWLLGDVTGRAGLSYKFICDVEESDFDKNSSTAIYRIFQEILTNIIKHADASGVVVIFTRNNNAFELVVKDNGKGINNLKNKEKPSLGFLGMQERILSIGGNINVESEKGKGTKVKVIIPSKKIKSKKK